MKIRRDCKNALVRQHGSCLSATAFLFRKPSGFSIVYHTRGAFADGKRGDTAGEMGQSLFGGCVDYTICEYKKHRPESDGRCFSICRRGGEKNPPVKLGVNKKALAIVRSSCVVKWRRSGNRIIKTQEVQVK